MPEEKAEQNTGKAEKNMKKVFAPLAALLLALALCVPVCAAYILA